MAYPRWLAKVNKRVFNPREVRKGKRPVVVHVGRRSGAEYRTPLDAHPTTEGFVLVARYGPGSDWVRNVQAAGTAVLRFEGQDHQLVTPRLVGLDEAAAALAPGHDPGKDFAKAEDYLLLERAAA
ncbi:MAG: nitroreductase family deazaflavin-dependent oxidoreductase [Actinomycetota bacterium]